MLETGLKTVGIDHVVLHLKDVACAKRFYIDVLGITVNHESSWQAFRWCANQQVALFEVPNGTDIKPGDDLNHVALRLESGIYQEVKAHLE